MRRHLLDVVLLGVLASGVAAYLAFTEPQWRSIVIRAYVFVLGALLMLVLVSAAGDALPRRRRSEFERALSATGPRDQKLTDLERVQRQVTLGIGSAHDLHTRLVPQLREIANARLERVGRKASAETLGRWWDLLRPDREPPADRFEPGIALADLRACLHDLERIS
jgi:uncharacterized membrane protein